MECNLHFQSALVSSIVVLDMRVHLIRINLSRDFHQFPQLHNDHGLDKPFERFGVFRLAVRIKLDMHEFLVAGKLSQKQEELVRNCFGICECFPSSFQGVPVHIESDLGAVSEIFPLGMFPLADHHQRFSVVHIRNWECIVSATLTSCKSDQYRTFIHKAM